MACFRRTFYGFGAVHVRAGAFGLSVFIEDAMASPGIGQRDDISQTGRSGCSSDYCRTFAGHGSERKLCPPRPKRTRGKAVRKPASIFMGLSSHPDRGVRPLGRGDSGATSQNCSGSFTNSSSRRRRFAMAVVVVLHRRVPVRQRHRLLRDAYQRAIGPPAAGR